MWMYVGMVLLTVADMTLSTEAKRWNGRQNLRGGISTCTHVCVQSVLSNLNSVHQTEEFELERIV